MPSYRVYYAKGEIDKMVWDHYSYVEAINIMEGLSKAAEKLDPEYWIWKIEETE